MLGKKTINDFFTPVSRKRSSTEARLEAEDCGGEIKRDRCENKILLSEEERMLVLTSQKRLVTCSQWKRLLSRGKLNSIVLFKKQSLLHHTCSAEPTTPVKKTKGNEENKPLIVSPPLSPEQLDRMQKNKAAALEKRAAKFVPEGFGESWKQELVAEFTKPYFIKLSNFTSEERKRYTVYPPPHQVFTWTQMCGLRDVKVVILGQDPYHGPNQAHGLCFSVQKPVPPPPSLENMYKELQSDIEGFEHPGHGDLTGWAKQGVLLLNAVLTVRAHNANSHKDRGWEQFTDAVVSWLNKNLDGLVFMLWGAYAQKKGSSIDRKRHHVLQTVHPSPLSAHRGFFGCQHFSKTNAYLQSVGKGPIDWKKL